MIDKDFAIDPEAPASDGGPVSTTPKVVIVYRNRGLSSALLPPVLILLSAVLILSHQRRTPLRVFPPSALSAPAAEPVPPREMSPTPIAAVREAPLEPPLEEPKSDPPKVTLPITKGVADIEKVPEAPPSTPVAAEVPKPARELEPPPAETPAPKPRVRTAIVSNLPRDPEPAEPDRAVTREQELDDVRREVEQREAEIRRLEALTPLARNIQIAEAFRRTQANRVPFHNALREALKVRQPKTADAIQSVCDSFGRSVPEEVRQRVNRLLKTSHARMSRNAKIELMRAWGLPESMILDFVANDLDRMLGTRGGPRNEDEVLVWAARALLQVPPRPLHAAVPSPPPPQWHRANRH